MEESAGLIWFYRALMERYYYRLYDNRNSQEVCVCGGGVGNWVPNLKKK